MGEAELYREAKKLRRLLDLQPLHIVELDAELRVVFQNRNEFQFTLGENIADQFSAETRERCLETCHDVLRDGESRQFSHASLKERCFLTEVRRLGEDSERASLCLMTRDVTEVTSQQERSQEDRRKLAIALDATKVGLWSWNIVSGSVIWDDRMREMTGHDIPMNLPEWQERLMHPEDRDKATANQALLERGGQFPPQTSRIVRPDGQIRWLMTTGTICLGSNGQPETVVGGCIDVTEHQRLAEKLQAAQRMEALGHLTAGVAHNFNNMLMVITPCLEAIEDVAIPEIKEDVVDALAATERAAEVVRQLMAFAGQRNKAHRTHQAAAPLVREVVRLCGRSFEEDVYFSLKIDAELSLDATPGAIQQVLSNVIFNARDALVTAEIQSPCIEVTCRDVNVFDEDWVEIIIADNGPGVPADLRAKIFEPFVTTKNGKGTGLGLASSQAIVEQHGGQMACRVRNDGGSEFLVLLPGVPAPRALSIAPPVEDTLSRTGTRVLLVDDEQAIRRLMQRGLEKSGMIVETAESPESLEVVLDRTSTFDFVLLDRSLRGSQGRSLVPRLRHALPEAKIFYFTGEHVGPREALLVEGVVQKPVDIRSLVRVIQQAVGKTPESAVSHVTSD